MIWFTIHNIHEAFLGWMGLGAMLFSLYGLLSKSQITRNTGTCVFDKSIDFILVGQLLDRSFLSLEDRESGGVRMYFSGG